MSRLSKEYVSDSDVESDDNGQVFVAPADYKKCKHLKKFPVDRLKDLRKSNSEIWLINFPASLDISKLKTLPVTDNGSTSVKVSESLYEIEQNAKDAVENLSVLIPDDDRESLVVLNNKKDANVKFDKVFTISESKDIPDVDVEKLKVSRKDVPQVDGLIMRHFATGYDAKDFDVTENVSTETKSSKKRHHHDTDDSPKKKKKDKKKKDKK
ncbi:hypothetical protein KAFR_0G00590 [Kazachstania africana CBS 2517]|uniref:DNA-directed RNA polymerase I subunit RPA34 n=1 Tax=Kazachstania africana (strain ATCC 22294 / BCRC 22015 / CBS 2517 / CECT 1963 / NBRC 1671 / NRRL Y-8276) TaxID=1071382 RepID=H2AXJ2_KAZAF|nr:hypothetical protein KAFR_0G00590 [Kazachstania africana CBS 2517]CCF59092.1 hypothetical protein KAFR_0G00590 [Kazachstania africana CBS 2517]